MRKTWLWTLMGMIGLAAVSYALFLWLSPPTLPEGFLYGNGRIEATEVTVSAEVGGRVLESALIEGRAVRANDLLVRFDETDLKTRLKQAEANAAATLQQALLMSFLVLFPILFLSGTVVPLESMPIGLQYLAEASPLRHYMDVVLGLFLKGVGLDVLWPRLAAMLAIGAVLLAFSVWRFRRHLG